MPRHRSASLVIGTLTMASLACGLSGAPRAPEASTIPAQTTAVSVTPTSPPAEQPAPAASGSGTVTVTGDIQRSYTPSSTMGLMILDRLNLALFEDDQVSGAVVQFDSTLAPGTYDINDHWTNPVVDIFGEYDWYHDGDVDIYLSTGGTLTLTQTGNTFSGSFSYTAALTGDASRVITVEGSFEGVSPSS